MSAREARGAVRDKRGIVIGATVAVALGQLVALDLRLALAALGVVLALTFIAVSRRAPEGGLLAVLIVLSPIGATRLPQAFHVGPLSGLAVVTVAVMLATLPFWILHVGAIRLVPGWLSAFLCWTSLVALWRWPVSAIGVQNVLVPLAFAAVIALSRYLAATESDFATRMDRTLATAGWLVFGLSCLNVITGGWGGNVFAGNHSIAILSMILFGWAVASFRYEARSGMLAAALFLGILFSLARAPLGAAAIIFCIAWGDLRTFRGWFKTIAIAGFVLVLGSFTINSIDVLKERFYSGDVHTVRGVANVNTTGRDDVWQVVWDDYREHGTSVIGLGPGTGIDVVSNTDFGREQLFNVHNDYLQVIHDYGPLGFVLWVFALLSIARQLYRRAQHRWAFAAFLSLVGTIFLMLVEGPMNVPNMMILLAVLIGIGLASSTATVATGAARRIVEPPSRGRQSVSRQRDGLSAPDR